MTPRLKSTRAARDLIKAHEPFLAEAERRGKRWVVGYGHTASAKEGVSLKAEDAELLLIYDVMRAEQTIDASVGAEMAAPMRDALVSFALSVGLRAFKVSDVARLARAGRHLDAAAAIETWVRADEDGRLVVSDRLVTRRAAEKALYLSALEDSAARVVAPSVAVEPASESAAETEAEPEPEPEAESEPEPEPETIAVTDASADLVSDAAPDQAQADTLVDSEVQAEAVAEPEAAGLIELDIAFETPDERAAESALAPQEDEASPEVALAPAQQEAMEEGEADAEPEHAETDASDVEADDTPASEAPVAAPDSETDSETPESQAELDEMKAAQDASIAAVMARMAQQVSASIAPAAEHEAPVKLGYSFLSTAHVDMASQGVSRDVAEPVEPAPAPQPQPAQPKSLFSSPAVPMSPFQGALQVSSIKMTPIAPEALPQGSAEDAGKTVEDTDSVKAVADVSDRDDSLSVKIPSDTEAAPEAMTAAQTPRQDAPVFSAPPHPALAPASAPGLSGDVEGPDHPDKDDEDSHHDLHEDSEDLDPTVVGGSQTPVISSSEPAQPKGGDLMFISSLAVGGAMVGLGGWDIAANMDAYMELGLSYSPLGPIVFGAGVLLSAASVWFIIGRRNEK